MRHLKKSRRFGRSPAHRKAMFNNMVTSLFLHERILTTLERAKELRSLAEKLVTLGKRGDLSARRLASQRLKAQGKREGKLLVKEDRALKLLFDVYAPRYRTRQGGYTRIVRTGFRQGDGAAMAFIEMLPDDSKKVEAKAPAPTKVAKTPAKKAAPKPAKAESATKAPAKPAAKKAPAKKAAKKPAKKTAKKTAKKAAKKS